MNASAQDHSAPDPYASTTSAAQRRRRGDRFPGFIASTIIALATLAAVFARVTGLRGDKGEVHVVIMASIAMIVLTMLIWFVLRSTYASRWRYGVLFGFILLVGGTAAMVRLEDVTGEMVPEFRFRWQPPSDKRLKPIKWEPGSVDLATTTPLDFPQFLGPQRDGEVNTIALHDNWSDRPPKLIWKRPIGAGWSAFVAVNGSAVTMEQRGEEELVSCYDVHTGKPRWAHAIAARHQTLWGGIGPRATPAIHDGKVYALGATGILRCLNGANGKLLWKRDLLKEFNVPPDGDSKYVAWGRSNSPLVVDDLVVVPGGGGGEDDRSLVAFHRNTGERVWAAGKWQISYSSPIVGEINGKRQIVSVNEDAVSGHDIQTGEVLWSFDWPGSSVQAANTSQPLIFENSIIVSRGYAQGCGRYRIEGSKVTEVFRNSRVLHTKLTSAVLDENFAYGLSNGILECVDVRDGTRQWKSGRYGHGQILLVGDLLLVLSEEGDLALVTATPERFRELGRIEAIEGKTWNNLCLFGRFLLIRNSQEAACYELPLRTE